MAFARHSFDPSIASALGDDPTLIGELVRELAGNARLHADLLARARCDANWRVAAERLVGLAASFGAMRLMQAAQDARIAAPGDPVALRRVNQAVSALG
jgi:hypothetical protein